MNKKELIKQVARRTGMLPYCVESVLDAILENIKTEVIAGQDVKLKDFGKFYNFRTKEKIGRNIIKGTSLVVPETNQVKFKAFKLFKQQLNKK